MASVGSMFDSKSANICKDTVPYSLAAKDGFKFDIKRIKKMLSKVHIDHLVYLAV
jgi:hypothetical protein